MKETVKELQKMNIMEGLDCSYITGWVSVYVFKHLIRKQNKDRVTPQSTHKTENTQNITDKNKGINQQH